MQSVANRRPGQILVCGVGLGQQRYAFGRVAPRKAGSLRQALFDLAMRHPAADQPCHLRPAQSTDLGSKAPHDPAFDPDKIAEIFWTAHTDPPDAWQTEYRFTGA